MQTQGTDAPKQYFVTHDKDSGTYCQWESKPLEVCIDSPTTPKRETTSAVGGAAAGINASLSSTERDDSTVIDGAIQEGRQTMI